MEKNTEREPLKISKDVNINQLLVDLKNGINDFLISDRFKAFLDFRSTLYNYSFYNMLLIYTQKPDASLIGSYNFWKQHNRYVKKGEHALYILAPMIKKEQVEMPVLDDKDKPVVDEEGKELKNIVEKDVIKGFKFVPVFDISQTDGEPIPEIVNLLTGNSEKSQKLIDVIKNVSKVPIKFEKNLNGPNGYYSPLERVIVLKDDLSFDQTAKTLIHEYAHSKLHNNLKDYISNRGEAEVQAESTAYIVMKHFGLDTSEYSFGYITGWASGKTLDQLHEIFNSIADTSKEIISEIEDYLAKELQNMKDEVEKIITEAGFKPNGKVVNDIIKLNALTGKNNSLKDIRDQYKNIDKINLSSEEKECIKNIGDEFKNQEMEIMNLKRLEQNQDLIPG